MTSIDRPAEHIDLERSFEETAASGDPWERALRRDERRDWAWLVGHPAIALLAEAGSGKTHELRHIPDTVWPRRHRFFLRIETLCSGTLEEALDAGGLRPAFDEWLRGDAEGLFLLDAVDEAKLPHSRTAAPLRDALARFRRALPDEFHRVRVVVTCRSSEWHHATEQEPLQSLAASIAEARRQAGLETSEDEILAVTFAPLKIAAIERLGSAHGADAGFVDALRDTGALDHAVTPLDVIHYADAYVAHQERDGPALPRTRRELIGASIERRLAESGATTARSTLRRDEARQGARLLCFALAVAQRRELAFSGGGAVGLDAAAVLAAADPPWRAEKVRELLSTALFAPATPGLVRPYRPEVGAMLAAEYLDGLIARGLSEQRVIADFFRPSFGRTVVGRAYSSMLAWLASMRPAILRRMIDVAPEALIEDGDPRALALEDRVSVLEQHVAGVDDLPGGFYFQNVDLHRFAEPDLEQPVVRLLHATRHGEGRLHLLQIAAAGRYASAAPLLVQLAGDPFTPTEVRIYAMAALVQCGSPADLAACAQTLLAWGPPLHGAGAHQFERQREDDARHRLVRHAYPAAINAGQALRLLAQLAGKEWSTNAKPLAAALSGAPASDLDQLVVGLDVLCFPRGDGGRPHAAPPSSDRMPDLFRALVTLLGRAIRERSDVHDRLVPIHGRCLRTIRWGQRHGFAPRERIEDLHQHAPPFRLAIVDHYAALAQPAPLHRMLEHVLAGGGLSPAESAADGPALLERYARADVGGRRVYSEIFSIALHRMSARDRGPWRRRLRRAARGHRAGRDEETLAQLRQRPLRKALVTLRGWRSELPWRAEDWWRRFTFAARERWAVAWSLARDLPRLSSGHAVATIFYELEQEGSEDLLMLDPAVVRRRRLGAALVSGALAHARRHPPTGRSNVDNLADMVAFAGWGYLWAEDREGFAALPDADARRALLIALTSPLGWPAWAGALAAARPAIFHGLAMTAVADEVLEYRSSDPRVTPHILGRIADLDADLRALLAPDLVELVSGAWLPGVAGIRALRSIAEAYPAALDALRRIAKRKARDAVWEGAPQRLPEWLMLWAAADQAAIAELLVLRRGPLAGDAGSSAMARTLDALLSRDDPDGDRLARLDASLLLALASHLFETFPPERDDHREGMRVRDDRRRGEEARGAVLKLMGERRDQEGRDALESFVARYIRPRDTRWASAWLAGHARDSAAPVRWDLEDVVAYGARTARRPSTAAALLAAVVDGLRDVELDLATSEFDRRGLFRGASESDVRAFLGDALDRRHRDHYAITQETQTSRAKRTDLRCEMREGSGSVAVVEIKLLHRWTWAELIDKLVTQLLLQYLISDRVAHGVYLLVDMGSLPTGELPAGVTDVESLITALREIVRTDPRFGGRTVEIMRMCIDLPPLPAKSKRSPAGSGGARSAEVETSGSKA